MENIGSGVAAPAAGGQGQGTGAQPAGGQPQASPQVNQQSQAQPGAPVVQQGQAQSVQPQGGDQPQQSNVAVPLHVVTALRDEIQGLKAKYGEASGKLQQFEMMRQFSPPPAQQPQNNVAPQQPQPQDPFTGVQDDDLVTGKELKQIVQNLRGNAPDVHKVLEPINQTLAKVQVQLQDPQYEATIRTFLPEMINANPYLREMIVRAPNPLLAALGVARMSPRFQQAQQGGQQAPQQNQPQGPPDVLADLQRIIENATRPGAPGSMGGGGAVVGNDRFRTMTDNDFDQEVQRIITGGRR